jgi:hypothetical protein
MLESLGAVPTLYASVLDTLFCIMRYNPYLISMGSVKRRVSSLMPSNHTIPAMLRVVHPCCACLQVID